MTINSKLINVDKLICLLERKLVLQNELDDNLTEEIEKLQISQNKNDNFVTKNTGIFFIKMKIEWLTFQHFIETIF